MRGGELKSRERNCEDSGRSTGQEVGVTEVKRGWRDRHQRICECRRKPAFHSKCKGGYGVLSGEATQSLTTLLKNYHPAYKVEMVWN